MKYCPSCRTAYTDDTLQFCLQDGTMLVSEAPTAEFSAEDWGEPATVVRPKQSGELVAPPPKKSNMVLAVFLTFLATLLLTGGAIGAWYFLRNRNDNAAVNLNVNSRNTNSSKLVNANSSNTYVNANRTNTANVSSPTPSANANKTATPTPAADAEQIKSEVSDTIENWKDSFSDIDSHMSNYAERLDYYYNSRAVSAAKVRDDKQRAFDLFDEFRVRISNLRVTPDESGDRATAVFDKEWKFKGQDRRNEGKVQSQLQLTKIDNRWQITGEKDLKVYYTEK